MLHTVIKLAKSDGKSSKNKVYIVLHHEIMGGENPIVDEMVFYIVSSMEKALEAIKKSHVCEHSWWEIQEQLLDDPEHNWPVHVGYYGKRGGKLSKPPYKRSLNLYKKNRV